jgi:hypothetical protein
MALRAMPGARRVAGQALRPAQPPQNRTCRLPRNGSSIGQRIRGRPRGPSGTAPTVDENTGDLAGGGVAAHHDVGIAALLEVRIEDRFAGRAPARLLLEQMATDRTAPENPGVAQRPAKKSV